MSASTKPLYALVADQLALQDALVEAGGEFSDELKASFEAVLADRDAKLTACAWMVRNLQAEADKHAEEAKRQGNRAAVLNRAVDGLKSYVRFQMELAGLTKVDGVVRLQINGQPSIHFDGDPESLPAEFRRVIFGLDREAVLRAVADGVVLPDGVKVERGYHTRFLV